MRLSTTSDRPFSLGARSLPWLLVIGLLGGCASKNPLMEEPAATVASSPGAEASQAAAADAQDDTGVQTVKKRRFLGFLSPYRPNIQQGNFVSKEMVSQLRAGMTPEQVRFILGSPLLTDIFHANRWDYPFRLVKGNGVTTTSRVTVFFENDRLARVVGGDLPTEEDYLARIAEGDKLKSTSKAKTSRATPPQTSAADPSAPANTPAATPAP